MIQEDGVTLLWSTLPGNTGTKNDNTPVNLGKTGTHEVGSNLKSCSTAYILILIMSPVDWTLTWAFTYIRRWQP